MASVLVDLDRLDSRIYNEFYPRISHKQRKRIIQAAELSQKVFEDETEQDLLGLTEDEFLKLSDSKKYLAYENVLEMFFGATAELEERVGDK